ncbi:hypothetical protein BGZ58_009955 [Dissophora ornata]|nr:hypothetical protein BGZ58_009955 [Dissophora ornata]
MDEYQGDDGREPGAESKADRLTPVYGRDIARSIGESFTPFSTSWDLPSSSMVRDASPFRNMFSSPNRQSRSGDTRLSSGSRVDVEQDVLNVEKSRILEQLRHMTTEVDQLESRLQAARRRRARAVTSASQKHQETQEVEAQKMRQVLTPPPQLLSVNDLVTAPMLIDSYFVFQIVSYRTILGSIHHLSISDGSKKVGDSEMDSVQIGRPPIRTPLTTLSTQTLSHINFDMIRKLQSFTNITFTSIKNHLLSTSETGMAERQYHITGVCFQLEFMVEFTVREPNLDLKNVRIEVPPSAQMELGHFISRAQSECLLMPFFRTLSQYAQMDCDRQSLMNKLAKRFPQLVKSSRAIRRLSKSPLPRPGASDKSSSSFTSPAGPGVQLMTFCGARKSSPELVLQWAIDVTDQGKIIPHVRLLPRMPQKWRHADEKMTLDAIPTHFVRLLQLKGTEGAVAILLKCVYGRRATEPEYAESSTDE